MRPIIFGFRAKHGKNSGTILCYGIPNIWDQILATTRVRNLGTWFRFLRKLRLYVYCYIIAGTTVCVGFISSHIGLYVPRRWLWPCASDGTKVPSSGYMCAPFTKQTGLHCPYRYREDPYGISPLNYSLSGRDEDEWPWAP